MSNIICEVDITDIVDAGEDEFETESFSIEFSFIMDACEFMFSIHNAQDYSKKQWLDLANGRKDFMINNIGGGCGILCKNDNYVFDNYLIPNAPTSSLFTVPKKYISCKLLNLINSINYEPWLNEKM
jgi:hypothetical protein